MQSHKLGDAMFDEDDIFSPPCFDEKIYYDDSMPPIYDDYIDKSGLGRVSTLGNDPTILEGVEYFHNYYLKLTLFQTHFHKYCNHHK